MPVYKYTGRTKRGTLKKGTIESFSRNQAILELREKGISPREITETKATIFNSEISFGNNKVKGEDFVIYCRQFATLIRAGVSIVESTNILAQQTESKALRKSLHQVVAEVKEGHAFSTAAEKQPKTFPSLFVNMIRAAETSGNLDDTLDRLASYYEKQNRIKKKVQSTLAYPLVLLVVILAVVVFLIVAVVPSITATFESLNADLPAVTKLVLSMSSMIQNFWWVALLFIIFTIIIFTFFFKSNEKFHYMIHVTLFKLPVFGKLLQKSAIARMTRTLASLVSSSVPILQSLTIVEKVVENPVIGKVLLQAKESLEQGRPLSEPLEKSSIFPPLVSHMTTIGEQSGQLDYMLAKIADFYEDDVDRTVDTLKSLIEPLMIVLLAGVVGFIVIAVMFPMFTMYSQF